MIDPIIPLVELHRHLEGNLRLHVQVTSPQPGVMAFIQKIRWPVAVLANVGACRKVAFENLDDTGIEGLDHIEPRFSPWFMAAANHLDPVGIVEAVGMASPRGNIGLG